MHRSHPGLGALNLTDRKQGQEGSLLSVVPRAIRFWGYGFALFRALAETIASGLAPEC
jgi:hypothetical protein